MIKINKKTIGIPRSLLYYKYFPLWKAFFEELDFEVVISEKTNNKIVERGGRYAIDEICIPLKLYYGHVLDLMDKKVDYLFVPRYISTTFGTYMCPKFLGLPDLIRGTINDLPKLIEMDIDLRKKPKWLSAYETARRLGKRLSEIKKAYESAINTYHNFRKFMVKGYDFQQAINLAQRKNPDEIPNRKVKEDSATIALIGHGYNVHDPYINMDLIKKLRKMNARVVVLENLPLEIFKNQTIITNTLKNYWGNEEEILSAMNYLFEQKNIDGIIFICSFCCGPDSLIDEIITRDAKKIEIPYICLVLDEHSGQAGVVTRVEAFVDMIIRKKRNLKIAAAPEIEVQAKKRRIKHNEG
ncbi:MAG: acyl-CoA dehydratase activase-related protein [Candidatus Helarchaeota archaeon]